MSWETASARDMRSVRVTRVRSGDAGGLAGGASGPRRMGFRYQKRIRRSTAMNGRNRLAKGSIAQRSEGLDARLSSLTEIVSRDSLFFTED